MTETSREAFSRFLSPAAAVADPTAVVAAATACLERFTRAFNACDPAAMDAELHFPHVLLADGAPTIWDAPGRHPATLFEDLRAQGWACTRYERQQAVLVAADKVHFVVTYARLDARGEPLSVHDNLWIVMRREGRWGIAVRSY